MKSLTFLLVILPYLWAYGQVGDTVSIHLKIQDDTLHVAFQQDSVMLQFLAENKSENNLLLYNFGGPIMLLTLQNLEKLRDVRFCGASILILAYDSSMKLERAVWRIEHVKNDNAEKVGNRIVAAKKNQLNSTAVLTSSEVKLFSRQIGIKKYSFEGGIHYLQLLYYSGDKIDFFVPDERKVNDMRKYSATIFKGSVFSNKVILIVE